MRNTARVNSMVFLILIGASLFSLVFRGFDGDLMVEEYAQKLSPGLLEISESAVRLTDRGRRVLSGEEMWGE